MNRSGPTWTNWNDRLELLFYFFPAQALMSFRPHISFHRLQERMESRRETVSPPRAKCSCTQLNGRRVHGNFSRLSANASQTIRRHLNRPHLAPKVTATTTTTTDRPKISFIDCNFFFFFKIGEKKMDPAGSFKINNPFWRLTISRELMEDKISFKSLWVTFWPLSFSSQSPGTGKKKETNKHVKRLINVWKRLPRATITIKKGGD